MGDVFKTAKQGQMAPVRGRVKAMMAQPRAVAQARKTARQTTGFAKGVITDSPTKVINRLLSDEKGKPHSTTEGKEASIKRLTKRVLDRYIKKGRQQGLNPADVRSAVDLAGSSKAKKKQAGGHVKKVSHDSELTKWFLEKHGGTKKKKPHSTQEGRIAAGKRALFRGVKEKEKRQQMGPQAPARRKEAGMNVKKGGKVDKKWIQKAVNPKHKGYCTPMTKPTCTPARKRLAKLFKKKARTGWKKANGGTVVMPTVGNDVRTRAYKHGALIHPRPKPTTMAHGRGVGIAKRGW